jgi:CHAD domain-containing protein
MPKELLLSDYEFGKAVLQQKADALLAELALLRRRTTEKGVHDTRVQSRRMRAALEAFEDLFSPNPWKALYDSVKQVTRTLGKPRETGVLLMLLDGLDGSGDMAENLCREHLSETLRQKREKLDGRMRKRLGLIEPRRLRSQVDFLLSSMGPQETWDPAAASPAEPARASSRRQRARAPAQASLLPIWDDPLDRARRTLRQSAQPILDFRARYRFRRASDEQLHNLRIAAKKLRYAAEIFDPAWPGGLTEVIAQSRALQDAGGNHHDWCVLCEYLKEDIRQLNDRETVHLAFQIGRLLAHAEERRSELRRLILPALTALQSTLRSLPLDDHAAVRVEPSAVVDLARRG